MCTPVHVTNYRQIDAVSVEFSVPVDLVEVSATGYIIDLPEGSSVLKLEKKK
jgi:hypothetical protein